MEHPRHHPKRKTLFIAILAILFVSFPYQAFARYDPKLQWRIVKTDNFIIYYPAGHEALAQRVLSLCSEVHRDVTGFLGVTPRRCPIVLNPGTDLFNGFMAPLPNRISLYEAPLYTVRGFGPGSDILDLVFTHEYTHYAHITTRLGWYGVLAGILGDGIAIANMVSPGWLVEGVTTNTETLFTDGGRGRSPLFAGEMRSFTEGEGLWSLNAAAVSPPYAPPGSRIYLAGYAMVEYLNRTYGADAFARLGRYQAEHPLGGSSEALSHVTGKDPDEFYRGFLQDYLRHARLVREGAAAAGLPEGRTVLAADDHLESYEEHFWTERGTIIGFRRGHKKKNALVETNPEVPERLGETETGSIASLNARRLPDGRLVLAEIFYHPLGEGEIDTTDLVVFDPQTRQRTRLTKDAHIYSAALSPDGTTFVATRKNGMWIDLVLLNADGGEIRPLVSKTGMYFDAPCWSPDGRMIAAVVKSGRNADIVTVDPATGEMQLLFASDVAEDNEPEFSPDGKWLVFSSDRSTIWNIYAWNLEERKLFQLTSVPYVAGSPHLSRDGATLSYADTVRGVKQVRVLPFAPRAGKAVEVAKAGAIAEPDLQRLQPEVALKSEEGIPLEAYLPYIHIPYVNSDEEGLQAGLLLMGGDPVGINSYSANLLYGFESNRAGYDISLANRSFWPTLAARIYDLPSEGDPLGGNAESYWYREQGGELSAAVNLLPRVTPAQVISTVRLGSRLRFFSSLDDEFDIADAKDRSTAVFGELSLSRMPDTASRDMVPSWGQDLFLAYEKGLSELGGELPGYNAVFSFTQYVPSVFEHQGLALQLVHQSQSGPLTYAKELSIPRGYKEFDEEGDLDRHKNLLLSAEYHFPLFYTDGGIGMYAFHSDLLKGSLFVDYGAGWDGGFAWDEWREQARTSVGATLTNKGVLLALLPIEYGIELGYKTEEEDGFFNFIFKMEL